MKKQYKQNKSYINSEFYLNTYSWDSGELWEKSEQQLQSKKNVTIKISTECNSVYFAEYKRAEFSNAKCIMQSNYNIENQ